MNLSRKYKISKLLKLPLTKEEINVITFIHTWFNDLDIYTQADYYNSLFFINKEGKWVMQFHRKDDTNTNTIFIRADDFWNTLQYKFCLNQKDIISLLHCILKERFKDRIDFIQKAIILVGHNHVHIERAFKNNFFTIK